MKPKELIQVWFKKWEGGDFYNLPITENFTHQSPFGVIKGKDAYLSVVKENQDKFLGHQFQIIDEITEEEKACVRYLTTQSDGFKMQVSEWYYFKNDLIEKIVSYYHIGTIQKDKQIDNYQ
ncbi:nuclear transport factor 2 family protein [Mesonia sp. K7]|uniref:nuclear transport factor 2 family protein n=1 Tax=Mesonia sp. K7 TaxID=2218606 RepID=UPI000DA7F28E|nr:nuclear transport factor 2 family protein [Mesonia sp. K7]PZD78303.1 hypothetical protein DNG35_06275 [Mesonia sp. K7]